MKTTKQYIQTMALLLTALSLTACSSDDIAVEDHIAPSDHIVTLTATLLPKGGAETRALKDPEDGTLKSEWAVNEELSVGYKNTNDENTYVKGTITSVDASSGSATITVDLTNPKEGNSTIEFCYPYNPYDPITGGKDAYTDQIGTLDDVSANYDECAGSGALSVSGGVATLPTGVEMKRRNCVWKFTFTDGTNDITSSITKLEINSGAESATYTITPTQGLDEFYVSMCGVSSTTITITAHTANGMYRKAKSGIKLENGKLYTSPSLALTKVELGQLFASDGNVYADAAAVTAAGTTAIGVVAYLDQAAIDDDGFTEKIWGGGHGLVLCLKNAVSYVKWTTKANSELELEFGNDFIVSGVDALKRTSGVSGYMFTTHLAEKEGASSVYPAAYLAKNYTGLAAPAAGTTGWFLPSAQQWVRMMTGLGGLDEIDIKWGELFDENLRVVNKWNAALQKAGNGNYDSMQISEFYHSSSEESYIFAVFLNCKMGEHQGLTFTDSNKNVASCTVRPVLAF